ncbi:hypothetical protein [Paenibacillus assamensis]|uniref:hypothetical protein n=1 Tax=Paenibacillus assamensis TaxID=311244 RepID=UPI0003FE525E|nr:hypothetical protein [Paenibacillus assamensis]
MIDIQQAHFKKTTTVDGKLCAEVEIIPFGRTGNLLAYVTAIPNGGYEIVRVLQAHVDGGAAQVAPDVHQALESVAEEEFSDDTFGCDWKAKAHFLDNLLACPEVRSQLDSLNEQS